MKIEDRPEFKRSKEGMVYLCNNERPFKPPEYDNAFSILDIIVACFVVLLIAACMFMIVVGIVTGNIEMVVTHLILLVSNVLNLCLL